MNGKTTISIIGTGLLGASLGLALKKNESYHRIAWARRKEVRDWALTSGTADETCDSIEEVLGKSDIIVLALPIPHIIEYIAKYAPFCKKGSIVTDIGSVKSEIVTQADECFSGNGVIFVGSHPMAGTEKSGPENAFAELYENADIFTTPTATSNDSAMDKIRRLWLDAGAKKVIEIDPVIHDELVSNTSHVLHVVASALALSILSASDEESKKLRFAGCATGFRDTSRIASSNPVMWREIIEHNTPAVLSAIDSFEKELSSLRRLIEKGDFDAFEDEFAKGKELRDSWLEYKKSSEK